MATVTKSFVRGVIFALALLGASVAVRADAPASQPTSAPTPGAAIVATDQSQIASHALLSCGSDQYFYFARVGRDADGQVATIISVRPAGAADNWQDLPPAPGAVVELADAGGEVAYLMEDGSWFLASIDGASSGPALPGNGIIHHIAGDGQTLWAIGTPGDDTTPAPDSAAPSTAPTTQMAGIYPGWLRNPETGQPLYIPGIMPPPDDAATPATTPSTNATAANVAAANSTAATPPRIVPERLFRLDGQRWTDVGAAPPPAALALDAWFTMAIFHDQPAVAYVDSDHLVHVLVRQPSGQWQPAEKIHPSLPIGQIRLLALPQSLVLWTNDNNSPGNSAGVIYRGGGQTWSGPATLRTQRPAAAPEQPEDPAPVAWSATMAINRLRVLWALPDGTVRCQTFDDNGAPINNVSTLGLAQTPDVSKMTRWFDLGAIVVLVTATFVGVRGRGATREAARRADDYPLASFGRRFVAGVIDAAPLFVAIAIVGSQNDLSNASFEQIEAVMQYPAMLAMLVYLIYTTGSEILCGATVGKLVMGLKVMRLDGKPPTILSLVLRNALRIVDVNLIIPLALIYMTPLRQRLGDLSAGTVVVFRDEKKRDEAD